MTQEKMVMCLESPRLSFRLYSKFMKAFFGVRARLGPKDREINVCFLSYFVLVPVLAFTLYGLAFVSLLCFILIHSVVGSVGSHQRQVPREYYLLVQGGTFGNTVKNDFRC
jgi:hypothetical protein